MLIKWNGCNSPMASGALVDVPCIVGSIGGNIRGILVECKDRRLLERAKIGDIVLVKRLGEFS